MNKTPNHEPEQELSDREREILALVATGATNQQIARALYISPNTVKTHLRNIFAKLGVESRTEATLFAIQRGLVVVEGQEGGAPEAGAIEPPTPEAALERYWASQRGLRPLGWARSLALAASLLLALLVLLWPGPRPSGAQPGADTRLFDLPNPGQAEGEQGTLSRWRDGAQMPGPAGRFAQAEVGGLIYVISGAGPEGLTDAVRVYDVAKDVWEHGSPKPTPAANIGAAVLEGRIYVPGGLGSDGMPLDRLEIYEPLEDRWTQGPSLPVPLCAYAIVAYGQGFYLLGGWDGQRYLDTVYYYDIKGETWRLEGQMPTPRGFAAAALADGRIYLVGGYDGEAEYRTCESYDPALAQAGLDPWRSHAPMRSGRAGHASVTVLGHLYVLGGGWEQPFAVNERYDVANDVWSTFDSPVVGEWRTLGASRIDTGAGTFIYTIGGWSGNYLSAVRAYQAFYRIYLP
jgi:DNA-binding CsgD family transcriptional regulator